MTQRARLRIKRRELNRVSGGDRRWVRQQEALARQARQTAQAPRA